MANFSQSKIKSFRRCQKQYSFRADYAPYEMELVAKYPSLPLKIGGWLHKLQEAYHREWAGLDASWEDVHADLAVQFGNLFDEEKERYGDLPDEAYRLFRAYTRHWEKRGDADRYTVATLEDGSPAVEFITETPLSSSGKHMFKGRIDLMVEDHEYGGLWIWDAKWVKSLPSPDERMMNPQSLMYPWSLRENGYDVRGFVFNYGRKKPPAIPALLKKGFLTTKHSLDSDEFTYLREIRRVHGDSWKTLAQSYYKEKILELRARHKDWFRRERVPVEAHRVDQALLEFKTSVRNILKRDLGMKIPRTYEYNCKFSCNYHDLCVAEFNGLDIEGLIKANFVVEPERYSENGEGEG